MIGHFAGKYYRITESEMTRGSLYGIHPHMIEFKDLNISDVLLSNISAAGYKSPTEIQFRAIPTALNGLDILGIAQTGTGKTAAFCLPILQRLLSADSNRLAGAPRALILAPTRELCSQIVENIITYSKNLNIKTCAIYGGVGQKDQEMVLKAGIDIVVATPGRLLDLIGQRILRISKIEALVLDEVDRMLNMGFIEDVEKILELVPEESQRMMFSATLPREISRLADTLLTNPVKIEVAPPSTVVNTIKQKIIFCQTDHKFQLLKKIIKEVEGHIIVFTTSKVSADQVVAYLMQSRIPTGSIHADKKQSERERHLQNFKSQAIKVLVATDIASRGIDIEGVTHVINYELPLTSETYIHRIGRTGRSGKDGVAISFCDESELHLLEKIKRTAKTELVTESFQGKFESRNLKSVPLKKAQAPTPGRSQESTAYLDHSKRQKPLEEGKKRMHPGFRKTKKRK